MSGFESRVFSTGILRCVVMAVAMAATPVLADEQPINTERPGFSSSPFTLSPGALQWEAGYQYLQNDDGAKVSSDTLPQLLIRYGLTERLEVQLGWTGYTWAESGSLETNGSNDASLGVKWQLTERDSRLPVSLFAGLSLPVGDRRFSSDEFDPTVGAFWSYDAALAWFGTVLVSESDDETVLSNALGISLPLRESLGGYVEYFGNYGDGGPEHYVNGGLTYLSALTTQFDVHVGLGLNDRSDDLFIGVGVAHRY